MTGEKQLATLAYAIRPRVVGTYLGQIGLVLSVLMLVPAGAALLFAEWTVTAAYFGTAAVTAILCLPLARIPPPERIQANEALVISALSFAGASAANTLPPLVLGIPWSDALFEAVSAVTTTGLSTLPGVEALPAGFLFARAWTQWYGGLGIVVLSVALLSGQGVAFRRLVEADGGGEDLVTTTRRYARRVLLLYCALSAVGVVALYLLGTPLFHAATHVMSGISTAGFSSYDENIAALPGPAAYVLMLLAIAGGISLPLYFSAMSRDWRVLYRDPEPLAFIAILLVLAATLVLLLSRVPGLSIGDALYHGGLLAFSAHTTTGFYTLPPSRLPPEVLIVLVAAMAVGGSLGSTAGGMKLMRVLLLAKLIANLVRRSAVSSHAVTHDWWGSRRLEAPEVVRILLYIMLFIGTVFLSWLPFVLSGYDPLKSLFEVVSATATAGLSTGIVSPELPTPLKLLLCLDMLAGRVEVLALLVLLYPGTWVGRRSKAG